MSAARRVRRRVGDIVAIPLSEGRLAFAWVLPEPLMAFFDFRAREPAPPVEEIAGKPIAFSLWVMNHAVTSGLWPVLGRVTVPEELLRPPAFFKQDPLSGALSITHDGGDERPASREECLHLERAAVWEPGHVVDRLEDHFAGRPNKWVESLRVRG
ncbi:immunity 26/phosphotriesterase HocA family protein [Myxococcus sp. RHSTA-1-4]|uniref:immunity 26/phosphotriesterase HocA family protein n=1 Tax=Myxococcus sp. RHSTA-1-4 TaxID=2874601 RepID=UPI001CBF6BF1|nr:immunity 26/phosphotriesterase HocA family protein [Myxococcus sp. RHSTA-1-4]MBZ4417073.1 immunity 26/phosphotriesterase HocA family protein [Myxococcus sp. RHSTA-1-4]